VNGSALTTRTRYHWRNIVPDSAAMLLAFAAVGLGLLSLALSGLTATARAKLWLGPQTTLLGGVGLVIAVAIAAVAWRFARASADRPLQRRLLSPAVVAGVLIACAILAAMIARFAFHAFPNSADEYGFLFQARTFLHLRLWNAPPPDPVLFAQNYLIARDGRWISQYLPGWPAILALFQAVGLPPWWAAPVCGSALLFVLWQALRLECRSPALVVALLLTYAATDFFLLNAATYFSHCASALMVMGGIVCMLRAGRSEAWWWPAGAGACVGLALLCRVDSGLLVAIAALAAWIEQGWRRRTLLLGIAGAAPPVLAFLLYNTIVTGNPMILPTVWAGNLDIGEHGLAGTERPPERLRMLVQTLWRLGELADTASLLLPALYVCALWWRFRARQLRFYDVVPIANVLLFLLFPDVGGFQMGPRYWFDGFVVMHITVGSAFAVQPVARQRFALACALLLIPVSLARLQAQVAFEAHVMRERSTVYRLARTLPAGRTSIVLVNDFYSTWNDRYNRTTPNVAKDFARNGTRLAAPVLFARGDAPDALGRACRAFPDAAILTFQLDGAHPNGRLEPVACNGNG